MTFNEFWFEDARNFEASLKGYRNRINRIAWLNGLYVNEAISCAINNFMPGAINKAFSKHSKVTPLQYHSKPIDMSEKVKEKQPENNDKFNNWVHKFRQLKGGADNA